MPADEMVSSTHSIVLSVVKEGINHLEMICLLSATPFSALGCWSPPCGLTHVPGKAIHDATPTATATQPFSPKMLWILFSLLVSAFASTLVSRLVFIQACKIVGPFVRSVTCFCQTHCLACSAQSHES